jgi:hypothetical protein
MPLKRLMKPIGKAVQQVDVTRGSGQAWPIVRLSRWLCDRRWELIKEPVSVPQQI